jgi:hypothetical protein
MNKEYFVGGDKGAATLTLVSATAPSLFLGIGNSHLFPFCDSFY